MRFLKMFFPLFGILLLSGCWDYNELNMQELVLGIGIDEMPSGMRVTVQTAGADGVDSAVYVTDGEGFFDAVRNATSNIGKKLYWGHCRLIVFGEEAARTRIGEVSDVLERSQDVYPNISVAVSKGASAQEVISGKIQTGSATDSISDTLSNAANSKRFRDVKLWELMREMSMQDAYVLPTVTLLGENAVVGGGAVVKEKRLLGFLDDEAMLMHVLMTQSGSGGYLPPIVPKADEKVSLEILKNDAEIAFEGDLAEIRVRIVLSLGSGTSASDDELRHAAESYLNTKGAALIRHAEENEYGDIFGISRFAQKKGVSDWSTAVKFDVVINRAGMLREGEE